MSDPPKNPGAGAGMHTACRTMAIATSRWPEQSTRKKCRLCSGDRLRGRQWGKRPYARLGPHSQTKVAAVIAAHRTAMSGSEADVPLPLFQRLEAKGKVDRAITRRRSSPAAAAELAVPPRRSKRRTERAVPRDEESRAAKPKRVPKPRVERQKKPHARIHDSALPPDDLAWALEKAARMRGHRAEDIREVENLTEQGKFGAVAPLWSATIIFAQGDGGSAVCISPEGDIVTCAHCLGDEPAAGAQRCLLFADGTICLAEARAVSVTADLAILRCTGVYTQRRQKGRREGGWEWGPPKAALPFAEVCREGSAEDVALKGVVRPFGRGKRKKHQTLDVVCIGQSILKRHHNIIMSTGEYLGIYDEAADISDNHSLGQLMHSAWTYYGTSGGPLFYNGKLIGLHSSYDSSTATRHGIHYRAIAAMLASCQ